MIHEYNYTLFIINVLINIYYFNPIIIVIGKISTVNKYASISFFNIDFGDFIAGELISNIWAPPDYDAKFYLYWTAWKCCKVGVKVK